MNFQRLIKNFVSFGLAAVILSVPLSFLLPTEISFENGLLENLQVVVLIVSAIIAVLISNVERSLPLKMFNRFLAMTFFLISLRELSWGRVFFPVGMETLGPVFVKMTDYKYRVEVYIFLAAYVAAMLFVLIKFVPVKKLLTCPQPAAVLLIIAVALVLAYIGDHGLLIDKARGQILEEFNELIIYLGAVPLCLHYNHALQS